MILSSGRWPFHEEFDFSNWLPNWPWPVEVKSFTDKHFERQVVFELATPPVIRTQYFAERLQNENHIHCYADLGHTPMESARPQAQQFPKAERLPGTAYHRNRLSYAPTSDQSWLTLGTIANGVVSFSFTANSGATRTAHITLFGVNVTVTQAGIVTAPTLTGARMLDNGAFLFSFTNNDVGSFTVVSTTTYRCH